MKTNLEYEIAPRFTPAANQASRKLNPPQATPCASLRLSATVVTKACLRSLRQAELDAWQQTGGDFLAATVGHVVGQRLD